MPLGNENGKRFGITGQACFRYRPACSLSAGGQPGSNPVKQKKMDIFTLAEQNRQAAWKILETTGIIRAWEDIGARVNIVGSLKSGLMAKHKDIDMHIYTDAPDAAESFSVIRRFAANPAVKEIHYKNLLDTEEACIEWHVLYREDGSAESWKFDMIHIRKGSKYDGVVEKVTDAIIGRLTPEIKQTILQLKFDIPDGILIPGIEIYHAVFAGGVRSYPELKQWRNTHPLANSLDWMP